MKILGQFPLLLSVLADSERQCQFLMPLKKINLILKVSLLLAGWPSWLSDGANETQVRRTSPYGTVSYFFA